jgi:signal transduction histidine kinase
MINFNLRNRIAFLYMAFSAVIIAVLLAVIYFIVLITVYSHLDEDLDTELAEVTGNVAVIDNKLIFTNKFEWEEKEHSQIEVNPTFIQVFDSTGKPIKKTGNLKDSGLKFRKDQKETLYFDRILSNSPIRQVQSPIWKDEANLTVAGFVSVAISLEESSIVLANLKYSLLISYPLVLLILFFASRIIAGRAIAPINRVIETAAKITKENLDERITVPNRKDEIYTLSVTINGLLDRLEDVVKREIQFTADASHELRTPLAVIKGTLEVLNRKPREPEQYIEKIDYVILEVDRITSLIDSLLELARLESAKVAPDIVEFDINKIIKGLVTRFKFSAEKRNINFVMNLKEDITVAADPSMFDIILSNIVSNAVKYSNNDSTISIETGEINGRIFCSVIDSGKGIPKEYMPKIFDRFYRVDESRDAKIAGKGLGLSIAKKLADLQAIEIAVKSQLGEGTTFTLFFNKS